jgi:hypothetical protein
MLFTNSGTVYGYDLGAPESGTPLSGQTAEPFDWFEQSGIDWKDYDASCVVCSITYVEGAASPDLTKLALVVANDWAGEFEIVFYTITGGDATTGNPPTAPTFTGCTISPPDSTNGATGGNYPEGGSLFRHLSWSPDSSALAFEYNGAIWTASLSDASSCSPKTGGMIIANASDPSWGPANVNPAPRPQPPPPPPPPPVCHPLGHCQAPPKSACAGLAGAALQDCAALQVYKAKLANCDRRFGGAGKRAKAKDAACRKAARTAYHRTLALIKCGQIKNKRKHAACVAHARRVR